MHKHKFQNHLVKYLLYRLVFIEMEVPVLKIAPKDIRNWCHTWKQNGKQFLELGNKL